MSVVKIKILGSYVHPKTKALIVKWEFDTGLRSNTNFPPSMFEGLSKEEIKAMVLRQLNDIYDERKRQKDSEVDVLMGEAASELEGTEVK